MSVTPPGIRRQQDLRSLPPGRHADSGPHGVRGLYLSVSDAGARSWTLRTVVNGRRREIGLGSLNDTPLSIARDRAVAMRQQIRDGLDPVAARARARKESGRTFETAAREAWKALAPSHRNEKASAQWMTTLEAYAFPTLGKLTVGEVTQELIEEALRPIWQTKQETARRVLQRIGFVIEHERARGRFSAVSPIAAARKLLGRQANKPVRHFAAAALDDVPGIVRRLRALNSPSAMALELTILTAARTKPVRLLRPEDVDLKTATWTAPAEVMKMGIEHRTPLSARAVELVKAGIEHYEKYVFPGGKKGEALSDMALLQCLKGIDENLTVHGFRSAFTDWCRKTGVDFDVQEIALAHREQSKVRRAYARGDLLDERRPVMEAWAKFVDGGVR